MAVHPLRRALWLVPVIGLILLTTAVDLRAETDPQPQRSAGSERVAVELTFLKAKPGERERLVRFIELNWFEMDRIAAGQGLMRDYRVLETGTDEGAWNVLVEVTYTDERGYAGIVEAFEAIRKAHRSVAVDGKGLRDLGAIVESKKTYAHAPAAPR
jgi:hypothetical protein